MSDDCIIVSVEDFIEISTRYGNHYKGVQMDIIFGSLDIAESKYQLL